MSKKKTTEEFKEEIRKMYGDRYILDGVEYVNNKTKVKLICREHGEFWMTPNCILSGQNCPICSRKKVAEEKTRGKEDFILKLHEIHPEYICDKVEYKNALTKVTIICPEHGEFTMTPAHLLEGHGCPKCAKISRRIKRQNTFKEFVEKANKIHNNAYTYHEQEYINNKTKITVTCPKHGDFTQRPDDHLLGKGCPSCGHVISKAETEIYEFVCSLVGKENVIHEDNKVLNGFDIDVFVPNHNFGIEYNGLRWHSEEFGKDRNYHLNKTSKCEKQGIRLVHIFEDEWLEHKDLVLDKIQHFLGKDSNKMKIGARKCTIKEIAKELSEHFLNKFHIQGFVSSSKYYGAFYDEKLVGVMTFLKEKDGFWNLTRFSTDYTYSIPGLANKMFKYFINNVNGILEVKTFLDRRWGISGNNVYNKMGFELNEVESPDYRYVVGNKRMHKFGFRKQKLNKKYGLPLTMTEAEMTKELGYSKIWDCGLFKYVWKSPKLQLFNFCDSLYNVRGFVDIKYPTKQFNSEETINCINKILSSINIEYYVTEFDGDYSDGVDEYGVSKNVRISTNLLYKTLEKL